MRRPFRWDKKYLYWGITAFCVIAAAIVFYMALRFLPFLGSALSTLLGNYLAGSLAWNEYLVTIVNMLLNFSTEFLYQRFFVFGKSLDSAKQA